MSSELEEAKAGGGWVGLKVNSSPGTWERPLGRRTVVGSPGLFWFCQPLIPSSGTVFCSQPSLPAASVGKDLLVGNALSPSLRAFVCQALPFPSSTTGSHS